MHTKLHPKKETRRKERKRSVPGLIESEKKVGQNSQTNKQTHQKNTTRVAFGKVKRKE